MPAYLYAWHNRPHGTKVCPTCYEGTIDSKKRP